MRLHQISDLHVPDDDENDRFNHVRPNVQRQLEFVEGDSSDLLLITGDLTMEDGSRVGCEWIRSHLPDVPVLILPGNHDDQEVLWDVFGPEFCRDPSFFPFDTAPDWDIVFANSGSDCVPDDQLAHVSAQQQGKPALLFLHDPPYPVGGGFMALNQPLLNQDEVAVAIGMSGIKHVFCGHYHNRADVVCEGVEIHMTPSPAFQIALDSETFALEEFEPAVRRIEIEDAVVFTELVYV